MALVATGLAVAMSPAQAQQDGALGRLSIDTTGPVTVREGFVGLPDGARADNPLVTARTGAVAAARAHIARYGGIVDVAPEELAPTVTHESVSGRTVVRFAQEVDDLPVIGGEVVVTLDDDRELGSMLATTSAAGSAAPVASVSEQTARRTARGLVGYRVGDAGGLTASSAGRWLFDPTVLGASGEPRTVWRIEVTGGPGVRHLVLVDDQTGAVLLEVDETRTLNRVVCDNDNVKRKKLRPCTSGMVRTESSAPSSVVDVEEAFVFAGQVAEFYVEVGDLDLTELLGIDVGGSKALASSVRWCDAADDCPYLNAFWDGKQMYYGEGFTAAEDVVGHEITHGVINRYSDLFYWGQSGAINESLADVMGELVDQRFVAEDEAPGSWTMGEDLQQRISPDGEIDLMRDLGDPTRHGQPDRMTSDLYTGDVDPEEPYADNGGVHTNSGVGNKTAYLISQGGTFNGRTITGIDGGAALTKTATLFLNAIQTLSSGSGYADLADVLEQGCADLVGTRGFTEADCAEVAKAVAATEMRTTPPAAAQPDDAPETCPLGDEPVVLLDSEEGEPTAAFRADKGWAYGGAGPFGNTAVSGESWANATDWHGRRMKPRSRSLTAARSLDLPADRLTYLRFEHWHLLSHVTHPRKPSRQFWLDGGTVEVRSDGRLADAAGLAWVNGPDRKLVKQLDNPAGGRLAFAGDSFGWTSSRVDLSDYAGRTVRPRFTMNLDNRGTFLGWFLDDITVYTCAAAGTVENTLRPSVTGKAKVGKVLRARGGGWWEPRAQLGYQWLRSGKTIAGAAERTYRLTRADRGKQISVRVTGRYDGYLPGTATSKRTGKVRPR